MLDTASGIGEALTKRPGRPDVQRREYDECRRAFRCAENGQAYRRHVLRHRGQGPVGSPSSRHARRSCRRSWPGAGHLIAYHVVTEGRCFTNLIGEEPIAIEAGEVIVFTKGDQHVLSSRPGMRADPEAPSAHDALPGCQLPFFINLGGDGPTSARFVCGFLACDAQPFNPLLDNLPTRHLAKWRMQIASGLLTAGTANIAKV